MTLKSGSGRAICHLSRGGCGTRRIGSTSRWRVPDSMWPYGTLDFPQSCLTLAERVNREFEPARKVDLVVAGLYPLSWLPEDLRQHVPADPTDAEMSDAVSRLLAFQGNT